ncbi:MAG: hypothetical protein J6B39_09280, partial [Lachnospiraceae bacterium]|nr:hypothetical protein [Lachnospiraceae bacterium]
YYGDVTFSIDEALPVTDKEYVNIELDAKWLTDSVRLTIGDYETAPQAWKPYIFRVPSRLITGSKQEIKLQLRNTALGLFEGDEFDRAKHAYVKL